MDESRKTVTPRANAELLQHELGKTRFSRLPAAANSLGLRLLAIGKGFWHAQRGDNFIKMASNPFARLILVPSGRGWLETADGSRETVEAGSVCWIPPESFSKHGPDHNEVWAEHWLNLSGPTLDHFLEIGALPNHCVCLNISEHFDEALTHHSAALQACTKQEWQSAAARCFHLCDLLTRAHQTSQQNDQLRPHPVNAIIQRMRAQPENDWDIAHIAEKCALTPDGLRKAFIRTCGHSPQQFLIQLRLDLAAQYLLDGATVQQAAQASGWHDPAYFSRQFRKHYGYPPSQHGRQ